VRKTASELPLQQLVEEQNMNRRNILATTALATAGFLLASVPAMAQTKWNLPAAYANSNFHTENLVEFAKDVERLTSGKLQITVHGNASLFKAPEIKRAVATGQAQIGEVLISIHENENALFGIDVVPFLATSLSESKKLWEVAKPQISKALDAQGLMVLMAVPWPSQGIYAKKELNTVADMRGLKWRAYNVGTARIAELVGAQPLTIQAAELPQALATGVADSFMSSGATGYDTKVWESLSHFYDTQAWIPNNITFVNKAAFNALDKATQDALLKAAADAEARGRRVSEEKTDWYLKELAAKGMKVLPPSPAFKEGLAKLGEQLTADWLKKAGADGQAVVEAFKKVK
jgi:TRAP-type C4-dicarboxylate transport system substrate-binding protein